MFTIKELKEVIKDLPDEMPVGLVDLTTDDSDDGMYSLKSEDFSIEDYVTSEDDEDVKGKALLISFENKLNPKPLLKLEEYKNQEVQLLNK